MEVLKKLMIVGAAIIALGAAFPIIWPLVAGSGTAIAAMTETDTGTTLVQDFWPLILTVVGIGIAIFLIVWAVRKFKMS